MNDLIIKPTGTPESTEAMGVHFNIQNAMQTAATAMVDVCRNLKTMRDKKLYTHLGFEKFEDYVEQAHGIKQRQAYTYIQTYEKLTPKLMEANADLGITKLALLCQVSAIDREDFVEQNDLANISVAEMEKLIEEKNGLHEQICLMQREADEADAMWMAQDQEIERLKAELAEKNEKIADLSAEQVPIDAVAVETEKIEAAVLAERSRAEVEMAEKIKEAIEDEQQKAQAKLDKQREDFEAEQEKKAESLAADAVSKAKAEWETEQSKQLSELQQAVADAQTKAAALEKELAIKGDDKLVRFSILFEQVQADLINCIGLVKEIAVEDAQKAEKYKGALRKACDAALGE